jgi:uncharacterized membrane protein
MFAKNAGKAITVFSNNFWFIIKASGLSLGLSILSLGLLLPAMLAGMGEIFSKLGKGEPAAFGDLFLYLNKTLQLFALGLAVFIASAAGVIFIFLPAVILGFWLYPVFYMARGNTGIIASLRLSAEAALKNNIAGHMVSALVLILINLLGASLLGLGLLFTFPLTAGYLIFNYEEINLSNKP